MVEIMFYTIGVCQDRHGGLCKKRLIFQPGRGLRSANGFSKAQAEVTRKRLIRDTQSKTNWKHGSIYSQGGQLDTGVEH